MTQTVAELTQHPESLSKETLYGLREIVARYPYFQAARLLFLRNLFLLHDASFGEELRKAALFVPDRRVLFNMVEGGNYEIETVGRRIEDTEDELLTDTDRTQSLIDRFLNSGAGSAGEQQAAPRRKPTVADATTDYVAFLLDMEDAVPANKPTAQEAAGRSSRSTALINDFIENKPERIILPETPEEESESPQYDTTNTGNEEDYFTETLAKIYIKQGRYEKALEIILKLSLNYPKKSRYFADQLRFLQKLIINKQHNKQEKNV